MWLEILSELFVNFSAAWFGSVLIELQISPARALDDVLLLTLRFLLGILSLFIAKYFREKARGI